jgi:hypothetical protein
LAKNLSKIGAYDGLKWYGKGANTTKTNMCTKSIVTGFLKGAPR